MGLFSAFWRYWKWLCVALMTSFVLLAILAAIVQYFKSPAQDRKAIESCLDGGGTWNAAAESCQKAG